MFGLKPQATTQLAASASLASVYLIAGDIAPARFSYVFDHRISYRFAILLI
jgi:hypothetical protein